YNLKQKEKTFAVDPSNGDPYTGLAIYSNSEATAMGNHNGKDWYYNSEEIPAYAHSFLLTGILSGDYADVTGNGISDDDIGDAVKFNYSKVYGIANPFAWRTPAVKDSVHYNEGLRSYSADDKGSFVYG